MTYYILSLSNDKSFNSYESQYNAEYIPSLEQIYNIFNYQPNVLSLDEDEDEVERLLIKSKKIIKNDNKLRPTFRTEPAKKKRGKKRYKESKKAEHTALAPENIITKIQVHYLNFIVSFLNDCVLNTLGDEKTKEFSFLSFNYKEKSNSSKKHLDKMKKSTILDILKNIDISDRYKNYSKNTNKMNVEALIKNPYFRYIFEKNFLEFFKEYYNEGKPLKEFTIFDKKIILSEETESFYSLLEENKEQKDHLIFFCELVYLDNNNNDK